MPYFSYEQFIQEGGNLKANFVPWLHAKYSKYIAELEANAKVPAITLIDVEIATRHLQRRISELEAGIKRRDDGYHQMASEIDQTLGRALGYPRYCDDQKNFPGSTDENGVCTGDHVPETLATEAARRIAQLEGKQTALEVAVRNLTETNTRLDTQLAAIQERGSEMLKALKLAEPYTCGVAACKAREAIAKAEEKRPTCDCHKHERRVCDVCQGVTGREGKDQGCAKS